MYSCVTIGLIDPKQIPEVRLLLYFVIYIFPVAMKGLDSFEKADSVLGDVGQLFLELANEARPELIMEVLVHLGSVDGRKVVLGNLLGLHGIYSNLAT